MPANSVFNLILDYREAKKAMRLVHDLYLSDALPREWEMDFANGIPNWPNRPPTVERAAKLLEIQQERRKRTEGDGMSAWEGLQALGSRDLQEWERRNLSTMIKDWKGYLQLDQFNLLSEMLRNHDIDFPPVPRLNYRMNREELAAVARQLRTHKRDQRRARRNAKAAPITPQKKQGCKGCGNDMRPVNAALLALQNAMGLTDAEAA